MSGEIVVFVTCPVERGRELASMLVKEHLVACVNILPAVTSIYFWKGELAQDDESLLIMKTSQSLWTQLEKRIKEVHPYEVPEVIAMPIVAGHEPYLSWLNAQIQEPIKSS